MAELNVIGGAFGFRVRNKNDQLVFGDYFHDCTLLLWKTAPLKYPKNHVVKLNFPVNFFPVKVMHLIIVESGKFL
jgi:hypothetical protein